MNLQHSSLVLASGSPRRTKLLSQWGIEHAVMVSEFAETLDPSLSGGALAEGLSLSKMRDVRSGLSAFEQESTWVLGADTLVSLGHVHLGKPHTEDAARRMLKSLSGKCVTVTSGVALGHGRLEFLGHQNSLVWMRRYSDEEIAQYVATGEPLDKAGSFAIQGLGGALVDRVEGSFSNIVGLPRALVHALLRDSGFPEISSPS